MNKNQKPTIRVERRRPGSGTPSGQRERAQAPSRERESGTSGGLPSVSSGGGVSGGLPSIPGLGNLLGKSPLLLVGIVIVGICCLAAFLLLGGGKLLGNLQTLDTGDSTSYQAETTEPEVAAGPTATRRPTVTPGPTATRGPSPTPGAEKSWLVLLYQDADDKILEQDIFVDLNEAEKVGSGPNLNIVAQIDRFQAGYSGDGNWTGTRRYFVRQDDDLNAVGSDLVEDLGEANMSSGDTLVDFVTWAVANYPAEKVVLILSDHGMGWPGGWSDPTSRVSGGEVPLQSALGDHLYMDELDQALEEIRQLTGIEKFELLGMDACLMGHIEVMSALAPHARYAVLSQETEPSLGWAYTSFLSELSKDTSIDGGQLGQLIVDSYIVDDQRIVDEEARRDLASSGSPLGSLFGPVSVPSAAQLTRQFEQNITLTALDLQALPGLINSLNALAVSLQEADQRYVAQARSYAQSFTSIFGQDVPASYIDLGNFVSLVAKNSGKRNIAEAVDQLQAALDQVVIANKTGPRVPDANGISIYFPNSQLYQSPMAGPESYTGIADRFASESLWDDFLAFHYTGKTFTAASGSVAVPLADISRVSPASGGITLSAITASATEVSIGEIVNLSVDIDGKNISYIKLLVGYLDADAKSICLADSDYLASPDTRELNGIYYPVWEEGGFTMTFDWEPIVFAIDDGTTRHPALFTPETYGANPEEAVYTVEGRYTFADSGDQRTARLYFVNGTLQQVFGFTDEDAASAPREIIPQSGDTFTILEKWLDLDAQGNGVQSSRKDGKTLTFGDTMFTWEVLDAAAGPYVVGFIVEDLDGNSQVVYQPITVR